LSDGGATAPDLGPVWPSLGVHVVFMSVSRADEIFVRVLLECHEGFGVARAHDPSFRPDRTLLTLLVVPDLGADCMGLLDELARTADVEFLAVENWLVRDIERDLEPG